MTDATEAADALAAMSPARRAAVEALLADGYVDAEGNKRKVRSRAHAEFLSQTDTVPKLPD